MSLASATGMIGHTKEYIFRGIQQLPLVMTLTTFFFSVTTGSIAHSTLFVGLAFIMPAFTYILQIIVTAYAGFFMPGKEAELSRSTVDVCKIIPGPESFKKLEYYAYGAGNMSITPSYWITSIGFLFGFFFSNGFDTLNAPIAPGANMIKRNMRYTQAIHIIISTFIVFAMIIGARFYFMGDCEGRGIYAKIFCIIGGVLSIIIGTGFYYLSKICGARSSDLFGVLSQMLPVSAMSPSPIACTEDPSSE
jgi:hypothetical protein